MPRTAEQVLCRFHVTTFARHGVEPLHEWIVRAAREGGMAGATVLKGFHGLREDGAILAERPWAPSSDLPVIVEVIDTAERITALLGIVEPVFSRGTITLERAHVLVYRAGERDEPMIPAPVVTTQHHSAAGGVQTMKLSEEGALLRIFIGESDRDKAGDRRLYEAIVQRAREAHLAGATVLRGPMGFGRHSRVHSAHLLELSTDLPVVIEIVDTEEQVHRFLPVVDELVTEGLVTIEAVRVLRYASPRSRED